MRDRLKGKLSLLFMVLAFLLAIPAVALAQDAGGSTDGSSPAPTIQSDKADYAPGGTVVLTGSNWQPGEAVHINVNDTYGATWSRNVDVTADASGNITDSFNLPNSFVSDYDVTATGASGAVAKTTFTDANLAIQGSSANATKGDTRNYNAVVSGGGNGCESNLTWSATNAQLSRTSSTLGGAGVTVTFNNTGTASVTVTSPHSSGGGNCSDTINVSVAAPADTTPPVINSTLNPANADGSNGWYKSNVSLTWSVTDAQSAVTKNGCVDQNITTDQQATTYSCSATSAGGSAAQQSVTLKRDATLPTNIRFVGGPDAGGTYAFGSVPNEPTCTADDATSTLDSCVVTGYSGAVGTHTLTATATDKAGNKATHTRTYTVNKTNQTITDFAAIAGKTYGEADFGVRATGGASGEPVTFTADGNCEISGNTVHITGAGSCTITASQAGNANYSAATPVKQTFRIDKAATTTLVTCDAGPFTYTGSALTPCSAKVTGPGLDQPLTPVSYQDNTNVGTATASASYAGSGNYLGSNDSETFTIDKAATATTVTCPASVNYNGSALTPCSAKVTGPGLDQPLTPVSYQDNTNAGTATASASYAGSGNYKASEGSKTFTIEKAETTTAVSCEAGPFVYKGSAYTPCSANVTGADGLDQAVTPVSYQDNTNAGTATASASYAGSGNYKASEGSKTFTIEKAKPTVAITWTGSTYDGTANAASASVKGVGDPPANLSPVGLAYYIGSTADGTALSGAPSGAGTYTVKASFDGNGNYEANSDTKTITIAKAATTTTVTCTEGPFVYRGTAYMPCSANVTGADGLDQAVTPVNYADNTNAGTATASAAYGESANYKASEGSKTFTIAKANQTITFGTLSDKVVGAADFNVSATASSQLPVKFEATGDCTVSGNTVHLTGAGSCTITASQAGNSNYNAAASVPRSFNVAYNFTGFSSPVDNNNVLNTAKAGQAIPLKWRLTDASGNPVTNLLSTDVKVSVANYDCGLSPTADLLEEYAAGSSGLQNLGNGYYQFNWKTPTNYANSCKTMTLDLGEGTLTTPHTALFKFTK